MEKKEKKTRQRYNWEALHEQYLQSETDQITTFLKQTLTNYKPSSEKCYHLNTKGWREEKRQLRNERASKIKEEVATAHGWNAKTLLEFKWNLVTVANNLLAEENVKDLKPGDIKTLYEIVKAEIGEATVFESLSVEQLENLSLEELEKIAYAETNSKR